MGVSLRYCDGCSSKLAGDQLESDEVLKIKDKVFCPTCKPKVIAQIKAQRAKQAAAQGGDSAPARPVAGKAAAKPAGKTAARGRAGAGGAGTSKGKAPARGARKPAAARRGKPGRKQDDAVEEASPRKAAGKGRGTPARGKPARGKPARGKRPGRARPAADVEPEDGESDEPQGFQMKKRSNAIPITAAVVLGLGGIIAVVAVFLQPDPEPPVDPSATKIEKPKVDLERERSVAILADAKKFRTDNPDKYLEAWIRFKQIGQKFKKYPAGPEGEQLATQLEADWLADTNKRWTALRAKVDGLVKARDYESALAAAETVDPVIDSYSRGFSWIHTPELNVLRSDCAQQIQAKEYLDELVVKATKYAKRNEGDIAEAIMDRFDKSYQGLEVWTQYEEFMKRVKKTGLTAIKELETEIAERQAAKVAAELAAEKAAREREWRERKDKIAWRPHINKHGSDYNWVVKHGDWNWKRDGTLKGNNPGGASTRAAVFGSHWQDYVLRFEMNLARGSMDLSPRTQVRGGGGPTDRGGITDQSELISFGTDDFTYGQYHWITVEVVGDKVSVFKGKQATEAHLWKTFDADEGDGDYRLLAAGGFCFFVNPESEVTLRNLETKLVSHNRKGMF